MKFKDIYNQEQFNPKFWGLFLNPFYIARKGLYKNISELINCLEGRILDIGCGTKPYEHLCKNVEYVGLEIDTVENRKNKKADFFYDGKKIPFEDKSFDGILLNQVFEHVFNPDDFFKEINRIVKIGGILLMTVPFVWDEHEQPYDFARYSSFALKHILDENKFKVIEQRKSVNNIGVIFQLLNGYIYKLTLSENKYLNRLSTILLMSPFNIMGLLLSNIFPKNEDLYLDNVVLARKVQDVL